MKNKKVLIITLEQTYRAICVDSYFRNIGAVVKTVCLEDYSKEKLPTFTYLPMRQGVKIEKVISDYIKNVADCIEEYSPDYIYTFLPPEELGEVANKWCRKNGAVSFIDVNDIDTDINLSKCSAFKDCTNIIIPVEEYRNHINRKEQDKCVPMFYFSEKQAVPFNDLVNTSDGSVPCGTVLSNNTDILSIVAVLNQVNATKKVKFESIGDCAQKEELFNRLYDAHIEVRDYGDLNDENSLSIVFSKWYYALNLMKNNVIGINSEAVMYLRNGVAMINNVRGDLEVMLRKNFAGINTFEMNLNQLGDKLVRNTAMQVNTMKHNARRIYIDSFTSQNCVKAIDYLANLYRNR